MINVNTVVTAVGVWSSLTQECDCAVLWRAVALPKISVFCIGFRVQKSRTWGIILLTRSSSPCRWGRKKMKLHKQSL